MAKNKVEHVEVEYNETLTTESLSDIKAKRTRNSQLQTIQKHLASSVLVTILNTQKEPITWRKLWEIAGDTTLTVSDVYLTLTFQEWIKINPLLLTNNNLIVPKNNRVNKKNTVKNKVIDMMTDKDTLENIAEVLKLKDTLDLVTNSMFLTIFKSHENKSFYRPQVDKLYKSL